MRVTQTISIGSLRINAMSNSSILQVGTSGAIKSHTEDIKEYVSPTQAETYTEGKITKELSPMFKKEGLPVEEVNAPPFPATPSNAGTPPSAQTPPAAQTPPSVFPPLDATAGAGSSGAQEGRASAPKRHVIQLPNLYDPETFKT